MAGDSKHTQGLTSDTELLRSLSLLYVEDDPEIREQLAQFLSLRVGEVYLAENGSQGLEVYREKKPDVIITDLLMTGMNGLDMAQAIQEIDPEVPIIVTTAYSDEEAFMRAFDMGIDRYVMKPIDPGFLINAITKSARLVSRRRECTLNDRYTRFLTDIHSEFVVVVSQQGQVEHLNRPFLQFLGFSATEGFNRHYDHLGALLVNTDGTPFVRGAAGRWADALVEAQDGGGAILLLRKPGALETAAMACFVSCHSFPENGKRVFIFSSVERLEERLEVLKGVL
ncbi:MAG: response regulator [Magnetococcales bacterium]|nr:response regulator [Magnetococcales bacterium]